MAVMDTSYSPSIRGFERYGDITSVKKSSPNTVAKGAEDHF